MVRDVPPRFQWFPSQPERQCMPIPRWYTGASPGPGLMRLPDVPVVIGAQPFAVRRQIIVKRLGGNLVHQHRLAVARRRPAPVPPSEPAASCSRCSISRRMSFSASIAASVRCNWADSLSAAVSSLATLFFPAEGSVSRHHWQCGPKVVTPPPRSRSLRQSPKGDAFSWMSVRRQPRRAYSMAVWRPRSIRLIEN